MQYEVRAARNYSDVLYTIEIPDNTPPRRQGRLALEKLLAEGRPLAGVRFMDTDFSGGDYDGADFSRVAFSQCDFSKTNLPRVKFNGASVSDTDFTGANLFKADLKNGYFVACNFVRAVLQGANIEASSLWDVIGNGVEIVSIQLPRWHVIMTKDAIQIGCQKHPADKWASFSADDIRSMSYSATEWWGQYKEVILLTHATLLPHWVEHEDAIKAADKIVAESAAA